MEKRVAIKKIELLKIVILSFSLGVLFVLIFRFLLPVFLPVSSNNYWILSLIFVLFIPFLTYSMLKKDFYKKEELLKLFMENENRYQVLFQNANDAIILLKNKVVVDCNNKTLEMFGYEKEQIIGKTIVDLSPDYQYDGLLSADKLRKMHGGIDSGQLQEFSWKHKRADQSLFDAEISMNTITVEGEVFRVSIVRDITKARKDELALKESQERYKRLSDVTFEGILIHNRGIVNDINNSFTKIFGYKKEDVLGKSIFDFLVSPTYIELVKKSLNQENGSAYEAEFIKMNGEIIPVEVEAQNYLEDGKSMRVAALRDISERKKMQHRILQTIINTEEEERSRVAKELHDGLGPLLSTSNIYVNIIAQNTDEKRKTEAILHLAETIEEAIISVQEISNNLSPHILQNFGLSKAVESFCSKISTHISAKIFFNSNLDTRLNREIEISLYRVIVELINNSLKYANAENIHISINYQVPLLIVEYYDDGKGFDIEKAIKEPKGMGLFNMFSRIESIEGKIRAKSSINKGLQVIIELVAT